MNKEKSPEVRTIQINYPAPYFHHSWSVDPEQRKKRLPRKLVSPYKSRNEVFTARPGHVCPNNPILTLEKAAKKLESMTKRAFSPRPKLERKKSPKKRETKNKNVILIKESDNPKPRKKSPRASSPHLKYGMFKKPPRMRGQTHVLMEKRRRIGIIPSSARSPVMLYRASPMPSLAISEIVHLDIKPRQVYSDRLTQSSPAGHKDWGVGRQRRRREKRGARNYARLPPSPPSSHPPAPVPRPRGLSLAPSPHRGPHCGQGAAFSWRGATKAS